MHPLDGGIHGPHERCRFRRQYRCVVSDAHRDVDGQARPREEAAQSIEAG
jgi:hypothetical protein